MSTVASPPRARRDQAPAAPARHGKCSLRLSIGGTEYRLTPLTPPAGYKVVWSLRKLDPTRSAIYQVAVERGQQPGCTCPDFEINGAVCKHVGALKALGLIPGRKARPAAARRSHARRLAEPAAAPAPASAPRPAGPAPVPGGFTAGFRRAVNEHLAMRRMAERIDGTPRPETDDPADQPFECAYCGTEFDPAVSRDPHLCGACAEEGACK
ncbi:MAG: SWIM zinc finger family protein [Patescibacteria group bacterium]|nr:SWIM zinc finger family protein [Patescibacteria group bacterium]